MKDKKNYKAIIFLLTILNLVLAVGILLALTFLLNKFKITLENVLITIKSKYFLGLLGIQFMLNIFFITYRLFTHKMDEKAKDYTDGEDAHFLTKKEIENSKQFKLTKFSDLKNQKDGTVFEAKYLKGDIEVLLSDPSHVLTVGTTGSGKTSAYIDPILQIQMNTKTKPSFVISDVKGELFKKHSEALKRNGYEVVVLNIRKPYESQKWNPFQIVINDIERIKEIEKKKPSSVEIQEIEDRIYDNTKEIIYSVCEISNTSDRSWGEGARDLVYALALAFIEDIRKGKMDASKLTLFNIHYNITRYLKGDAEVMSEYLEEGRDKYSLVTAAASTVLSSRNSPKTFASFISSVSQFMARLTDKGILSMTSENSVDFTKYDEKPTALFIQVPDERQARHFLVTILLEQCYKELIYKANKNYEDGIEDDMRLKRRIYFMLDEFANFPKFKDFETVISVARSRDIFFNLIVQNYEQLEMKYEKVAETIKNNCPVKVFLGSDSVKTMREFSELAGKKKGISSSFSSGNSQSSNLSIKETPLMPISELRVLNSKDNFGNALISAFGLPLKISKYTPFWQVAKNTKKKIYEIGNAADEKSEAKEFKEDNIIYDIKDHLSSNINLDNNIKEKDINFDDLARVSLDAIEKQESETRHIKKQIRRLEGLIDKSDLELLLNILNAGDLIELSIVIDNMLSKYKDDKTTIIFSVILNLTDRLIGDINED